MFFKYPDDFTRIDYKPGERAEYVWGPGMLLGRMLVESETPGSTHDCAQVSLVLAGEFDLTIGSETRRVAKGTRSTSRPASIIAWSRSWRRRSKSSTSGP